MMGATAPGQVEFRVVPRLALKGGGTVAGLMPADSASLSVHKLPTGTETNQIEVRSENGHVVGVTARVDVRRLDSKFGASLLQFAQTAQAVLVRSDGLVVEPVAGAFAAALRGSKAWRYANDPASFIATHLKADENDDEDDD
jgi:hypothetical protein